MSVPPLTEIIVSITNIVRRSDASQKLFAPTDKGEANFDLWQKNLVDCAAIIHDTWYNEGHAADDTLAVFERLFAAGLPSNKESL